jgi:hypothetical protein
MLRIGAYFLPLLTLTLLTSPATAQTSNIPPYFFQQWTVTTNCIQAGFNPSEQTSPGLQFAISPASVSADGTSYGFTPINSAQQSWPDGWVELALQYRPGVPMTTVPADFACVPGAPASSALLAMSNFTQSGEPYYPYEHWYALGSIAGEPHHFLIFPRNSSTGIDGAIIVLLDAGTDGSVVLDQDGTIHSNDG